MPDTIDDLIGYFYPSSDVIVNSKYGNNDQIYSGEGVTEDKNEEGKQPQEIEENVDKDKNEEEEEEQAKISPSFIEIASNNIEILFKDQYSEGFATIFVKDHYEVTSLSSTRFKRFLFNLYYDIYGKPANPESINKIVNTLQAKAEFGDIQYTLSLRVAEYDGDLFYDLTNEKHAA